MKLLENQLTRRDFLKVSGSVAVLTQIQPVNAQEWLTQVGKAGSRPDMVGADAKLVRSVCLMCHSGCGIQATIVNGELVKIDGNPYHPNTYDYVAKGDIVEESDLDGGLNGRDVGALCAKGQAGVYALYNPNRLKHPLKRVGPRGSGKWKTISWDQALTEICEGGMLFKEVPGEEARTVEGLKSILGNDKPMGAEDSDYMDEAPAEGWGPKRNQFVWAHGRNEQSPLTPRFVKEAAGSPNMLNHCDRCAGTFYNVVEHTLNVPPYEIGAYADYEHCSYLISVGSNITHADYPGQTRARYLQKFAKRMGPYAKEFKHVVVDPWLSPGAAKALQGTGEWIPLKPSSDAFFLIGMIRWMIENKGYKADFLALPNEQAAKKTGRRNWTDMTYLVRTQEPKLYLSGRDAGLGQADYVVLIDGKPTLFHEVDGPADLDAEVEIKGEKYKTVFRMLRERAQEKTIEECERACDIPAGTIAHLAKEFSSAKRPVIEMFRGPIQQSNGWWNGQALCILNMMVDNIDRKGGYIPGHKAFGGEVKNPVKRSATGVTVDRHKMKYQGKKPLSTRPWYPLATRTVTSEFFSAAKTGYPYRIKAYLNYFNNPAYTQPFNAPVIEALLDLKAIPLTISIDANMGETSSLCDYVLPDTEYLERIGGFKTYPPIKTRVAGVRQPVVGTLDPKTKAYRGIHPDVQTADDTLIQIAIRCGLPGFGKDGGGPGVDLFNSWQFWNEYYKNGDFKGEPGLDPDSRLVKLGGKFENPGKQYEGDYTRFPGGRQVRGLMAYAANVAANKNSMTGKFYDGLPLYRSIIDCKEQPLDPALWKEYPFQLHTHKDAWHTQSRTMNNLWLASIKPQNFAEMNPGDAQKLGVVTGDWVKVKSPSSRHIPFVEVSLGDGWFKMQVRVTSRIRPGVLSVSNSYGRWGAGGGKAWAADGKPQYHDKRIGAGSSINPLYMADPVLGDRCLIDPVAGGTQSNGTPLRVEKV